MASSPAPVRIAAEAAAAAPYSGATAATATSGAPASSSVSIAPSAGKPIPIFAGKVPLVGEPIWVNAYRNSANELRGDVAFLFGQNLFGRSGELMSLSVAGTVIYDRSGADLVDTASTVRFYDGTQTTKDAKIVEVEGDAYVSAWGGYVYAVAEDIALDGIVDQSGNSTVTAKIADGGSAAASSSSTCDAVSLTNTVLDKHTGRIYALDTPGADKPVIHASNGCRIISSVTVDDSLWNDSASYNWRIWDIYPIACTGLLLATYRIHYTGTAPAGWPSGDDPEARCAIVDPTTGQVLMVLPGWGLVPWRQMLSKDAAGDPSIDWKICYELPTRPDRYFFLRMFDRTDFYHRTVAPTITLSGSGNLAGWMLDTRDGAIQEGDGFTWTDTGGDQLDVYYDGNLVDQTNSNYANLSHWLDAAPLLTDIAYGQPINVSDIRIAGYYQNGNDVEVYHLAHGETGIATDKHTTLSGGLITGGLQANGLGYDKASDAILISADANGERRVYHVTTVGTSYHVVDSSAHLADANDVAAPDGTAVLVSDDNSAAWSYDTSTGTATALYSGLAATDAAKVDLTHGYIYVPTAGGLVRYTNGAISAADIAISDLITDLCALKGYSAGDLSFEGLTGLACAGLRITQTAQVIDLINRLGQLYGFTFADSDGALKFAKKRSAGSYTTDVSLSEASADLLEDAAGRRLTIDRASGNGVLQGLDLQYLDTDRDYENTSQSIDRPLGMFDLQSSQTRESLSLPIALAGDAARALLWESFYAAIIAGEKLAFGVGPEYGRIEPGDIVSLTIETGATYVCQARRVTFMNGPNTQQVEAETYLVNGATTLTALADYNPPTQSGQDGMARYMHLDIPLINGDWDLGGTGLVQCHALTTSLVEDWAGADLYRGDSSSRLTKIEEWTPPPATVGTVETALGDITWPYETDYDASITVTLQSGDASDLSTSTDYDGMLAGDNMAAYGAPGRWEIVQWISATDNGDGTYTLDGGIRRGRFGTEDQAAAHLDSDLFVVIDVARLDRLDYSLAALDQYYFFVATTPQHGIDSALIARRQVTGAAERPYKPADIIALHTPGSSDLAISWIPRSRLGAPYLEVDGDGAWPLGDSESYSITLPDSSVVTTSSRSYTWTGYATWYGSADQDADLTGDSVSVAMVGSVYGTGPSATGLLREGIA